MSQLHLTLTSTRKHLQQETVGKWVAWIMWSCRTQLLLNRVLYWCWVQTNIPALQFSTGVCLKIFCQLHVVICDVIQIGCETLKAWWLFKIPEDSWCFVKWKYFEIGLLLEQGCYTDLSDYFRWGSERPFPRNDPFMSFQPLLEQFLRYFLPL